MIEITSFVLGMLTIGVLLMIITLIAGMVKINKIEKQQNNTKKQFREVYENIIRKDEDLRRLFEDTHREINMVEKTIMNQIEKVDQHHNKIEDHIHKEIDQTKSYIDSRIDKVVSHGTLKSSKQLIK